MVANENYLAYIIRKRRTIHDFTPEKIPRSLVEEALDIARWAPNHKLTEPWSVIFVGEQTSARIVELNTQLVKKKKGDKAAVKKQERWAAVPNWLAVTSRISDDAYRTREDYAATCCFVQNFTLYLWSKRVGVKWTTGSVTESPELYDLLDIDPKKNDLVGLFWYGHPARIKPSSRKGSNQFITSVP